MAINFCTLTSSTLDAFCGSRRALVLNQLLTQKYPVQGTNNSSVRSTKVAPVNFEPAEREEESVLTFEQPIVTVTVEMFGMTGQDTQNVMSSHIDFVTVTHLEVETEEIIVSIDNLGVY